MWVFLIARESKSISELILSQLAYEKYNYAQSYNIGQSCQMSLSHLWWLQCVVAVVHLVGVGTALPAVSRGRCGFRLVGCHLCPSHGCCPWCSMRTVICPGGTGSSSRWHGRCWAQKLEKHFDFLPRCPSSFTRALSSRGGGGA